MAVEQYLSRAEAAKELGITADELRSEHMSGRLPPPRHLAPGKTAWPRKEIEAHKARRDMERTVFFQQIGANESDPHITVRIRGDVTADALDALQSFVDRRRAHLANANDTTADKTAAE